ncbi:MAG: hypothetical protein WC720_05355 [Candidatus Shapirobacteria bacterium]|jgi:hypothetical protein
MSEKLIKKTSKEHYEKYENLAQKMGISYKRGQEIYLGSYKFTKKELIEKFKEDSVLNNISLTLWDRRAGTIDTNHSYHLSLAEKVCLLKHLVTYDIIGAMPEFEEP